MRAEFRRTSKSAAEIGPAHGRRKLATALGHERSTGGLLLQANSEYTLQHEFNVTELNGSPMPRRRLRRANWPYRIAWCAIIMAIALYVGLGTLIGGYTYGYRSFGIDWWIAFVTTAMSATIATWFVAVGASLGSFLNVVAYRLPLGRTVGGHSGCPYCCTPIQRGDNVPVLAWIKLRGRCRTCHLPISAQYPLVEFLVGMVFLVVFLSEVGRGGANLPSESTTRQVPMYQVVVTGALIMRLVSYATILCGLVAAGLIEVKRHAVPLRLFAWSLLPLVVSAVVDPRVLIVLWRPLETLGPIESRVHAVMTLGLGALAGGLLAYAIHSRDANPRRDAAAGNTENLDCRRDPRRRDCRMAIGSFMPGRYARQLAGRQLSIPPLC